jgi:hypothetical protein
MFAGTRVGTLRIFALAGGNTLSVKVARLATSDRNQCMTWLGATSRDLAIGFGSSDRILIVKLSRFRVHL